MGQVRFREVGVGAWGGPVFTDLVDASACSISTPSTCFAAGTATIVPGRSEIDGGFGRFTDFPITNGDLPPNILWMTNQGEHLEHDPDSMNFTTLPLQHVIDPAN